MSIDVSFSQLRHTPYCLIVISHTAPVMKHTYLMREKSIDFTTDVTKKIPSPVVAPAQFNVENMSWRVSSREMREFGNGSALPHLSNRARLKITLCVSFASIHGEVAKRERERGSEKPDSLFVATPARRLAAHFYAPLNHN